MQEVRPREAEAVEAAVVVEDLVVHLAVWAEVAEEAVEPVGTVAMTPATNIH